MPGPLPLAQPRGPRPKAHPRRHAQVGKQRSDHPLMGAGSRRDRGRQLAHRPMARRRAGKQFGHPDDTRTSESALPDIVTLAKRRVPLKPSPPASKRSFLSSKTSLHSASLRTMPHQPSIGSISLFKSARSSDPAITDFGSLPPVISTGYGEPGPSSTMSKKPKGLFSRLKHKASRANVRSGSSAGGDGRFYLILFNNI